MSNEVDAREPYFCIDLIKRKRKYQTVTAFQALSDPTRLRIVELLARGALSSGEIANHFRLSPSAVSQHLKALKAAHLVTVRSDKQRRIYRLNAEGMDELSDWVDRIKSSSLARIDELKTALKADY